jgi:hypothetical protein
MHIPVYRYIYLDISASSLILKMWQYRAHCVNIVTLWQNQDDCDQLQAIVINFHPLWQYRGPCVSALLYLSQKKKNKIVYI